MSRRLQAKVETHADRVLRTLDVLGSVEHPTVKFVPPLLSDVGVSQQETDGDHVGDSHCEVGDRAQNQQPEAPTLVAVVYADHCDPDSAEVRKIRAVKGAPLTSRQADRIDCQRCVAEDFAGRRLFVVYKDVGRAVPIFDSVREVSVTEKRADIVGYGVVVVLVADAIELIDCVLQASGDRQLDPRELDRQMRPTLLVKEVVSGSRGEHLAEYALRLLQELALLVGTLAPINIFHKAASVLSFEGFALPNLVSRLDGQRRVPLSRRAAAPFSTSLRFLQPSGQKSMADVGRTQGGFEPWAPLSDVRL